MSRTCRLAISETEILSGHADFWGRLESVTDFRCVQHYMDCQ